MGKAALAQGLERHQRRLAIMPQALHVDADDGLDIGKSAIVGHGVQHFVGLLLVAGDDDTGAGMLDDILQLDPGIGRIDADRHGPDHLRAQIGVKPFRGILAGDGDAVSRFDAERQQAQRHRTRRFVIVAPGVGIPDTVILFAQGPRLAMHGGALS